MSGANPVAQAIGGLGRAVGQTGDLMAQLKEEQERQYLTDAELVMGRESARIAADLAMNLDPLKHTKIANDRLQSVKEKILGNENLSPSMYKSLEERIDAYSNAKLEKISVDAKLMQLENGKSLQLAKASYYKDEGRHDDSERAIREGVGIYYPPETAEILLMNLSRDKEKNDTAREINNDPEGWKERNPEPGADVNKWTANQRAADAQIRRNTIDASNSVIDAIFDKDITTPEQIDERFPKLKNSTKSALKGALADYHSDALKERMRSPEFQEQVLGEVADLIGAYNPTGESYDEDYIKVRNRMELLPTSPEKSELMSQLDGIRDGKEKEIKTVQDWGFDELAKAHKAGKYGKTKPTKVPLIPKTLREHMKDGFLKDIEGNLKPLGFSDDQIEEIQEADEDPDPSSNLRFFTKNKATMAARADKFAEFWDRRMGEVTAGPEVLGIARALSKGRAALDETYSEREDIVGQQNQDDTDEATNQAANKKYGKAFASLAAYYKIHPNPTQAEVQAELGEMNIHTDSTATSAGWINRRPKTRADEAADFTDSYKSNSHKGAGGSLLPFDEEEEE